MRAWTIAAATLAASAMGAQAEPCPWPLDDALRLVLVTTPTMNTAAARVELFARGARTLPWRAISGPEPAVVGKGGMGWGHTFDHLRRGTEPAKVEGDKKTPAGVFRLGPSFGFTSEDFPGHILIKGGETVCVEEPASPLYNSIRKRTDLAPGTRADDMRRTPLFRRGLFVQYPTSRADRRGSCIFIHIWSSPETGTAGCIGLPEHRVAALQEFSRSGAVIAIFPEHGLERLQGCLPGRQRAFNP